MCVEVLTRGLPREDWYISLDNIGAFIIQHIADLPHNYTSINVIYNLFGIYKWYGQRLGEW